jgi:serine/threonine protein kinase
MLVKFVRDLKPENILLETTDYANLRVKITDFGFACFKKLEGAKEVLGSPLYMAPEIIKEQLYDQKVDVWSLGVITYILLSGRPPFSGKTKATIFANTLTNEPSFEHAIWKKVSSDATDFIKQTLIKDPN